jgi:hypothetical protein
MPLFQFLDPGPLVDGDLELTPPRQADVEAVLAACRHPATLADAPELARVTRRGLADFLNAAPGGMHLGDPAAGRVPSYHFWMKVTGPLAVARPAAAAVQPSLFGLIAPPAAASTASPAPATLRIAGGISLRIGDSPDLRHFVGHVGYHVYPPHRRHRLAERATRLLLPLARRHGLRELWITANPDNAASRATCERLGAKWVDTLSLPLDHPLYLRGERQKCRYRLPL